MPHSTPLAEKGTELRKLHLTEDAALWPLAVSFPIKGGNIVEKRDYKYGKVWINKSRYFSSVSKQVWNFFIDGYRPAQKWLIDRKGHVLDYQDILRYGYIIYALEETNTILAEIDTIVDL